jgi:NAD-dependent SIR2 family protein deacetylase
MTKYTELFMICHNCHSGEETAGIISTYTFNYDGNVEISKCNICMQLFDSLLVSKDEKILKLLANEIIYCKHCDTYILINKGNISECDQCNAFHSYCIGKLVAYMNVKYQERTIEEYGFPNNTPKLDCLGMHNTDLLDAELNAMKNDDMRLKYLLDGLNVAI